jgi:hypothetical protein
METRECIECGREMVKPPGRGRPPTKCTEDGGTGVLLGNRRKPRQTTVTKPAPVSSRKTRRNPPPPPPPVEEEYEWDEEDWEEKAPEAEDEYYADDDEADNDEDDSEDNFGPARAATERVKQSTGFAASQKKANTAAKYLAEHGWTGSRVKLPEQGRVELTATRDIEMLSAIWVNGELVQPIEYTLWLWATDASDPYAGNQDGLPFDPMEATDGEIVKTINGRPIEWYNALAQRTEVATVNNGSVRIQHIYDAEGNESPLDRQITFTSRESGTRTIYLKGLRRVGKTGGSTRKQRSDAGQPKPVRKATIQRTTKKAAPVKRAAQRTGRPRKVRR